MKIIPAALLIPACLLALSCARSLKTSGEVRFIAQSEDNALQNAAMQLPGMRLIQEIDPRYWSNILNSNTAKDGPPDLIVADCGWELLSAQKNGELASLETIWPKTSASRRMPGFSPSIRPAPSNGFIPSSIYMWGIFYNRKLLAGLGAGNVRDMDQFVALLEKAKAGHILPIFMGASIGWAAWLAYLDLRLNGGKAAWERMYGLRPFDDAGGQKAANVLAEWRDAGYFSAVARASGTRDVNAVVKGDALFVLSGAFAAGGFDASKVGFMEVPFWKGKGEPRGEIVGLSGFAVPASAPFAEGAVALADAYLADPAVDGYWLPILFKEKSGEDLAAIQSRALAKTTWVFPPQERIMPPQFVQNTLHAWASFSDPGIRMSGTELAKLLQASNRGDN